MLGEITHLQTISEDLKNLTMDPHKLPSSSEQVGTGTKRSGTSLRKIRNSGLWSSVWHPLYLKLHPYVTTVFTSSLWQLLWPAPGLCGVSILCEPPLFNFTIIGKDTEVLRGEGS